MKHFVTLAALLTSMSVQAQMPYNPDANNDGQIGAFDLTSLLSIYSGSFSSGVLGDGTEMAILSVYETPGLTLYRYDCNGGEATSWVIDLSLVPSLEFNINHLINVNLDFFPNGASLTILKPSNWAAGYINYDGTDINGESFGGSWEPFDYHDRFYAKFIFWNGELLPEHSYNLD